MLKGVLPVAISNARIPTAQMSTFSSYYLSDIISGDRYKGVPQIVLLKSESFETAHPKSHNFTQP
jgi:hypothetical protein